MGLVLLEAQASGTAVIGSRVGGIPEFIQVPETGRVFDSGDADQLASLILELIEGKLVPRPATCRSWAEQFDWERVAEQHTTLYKDYTDK